ncbi:MAG: hypothetical protein FK734_04495 [Asgard group archaeon]|nr:hypothetical protein [Asgard group archaeon]
MRFRKNRKQILFTYILSLIISLSLFASNYIKAEENPEPFFYIDILTPSSGTITFNSYASQVIAEYLPRIGIGIDMFESTGWSQIIPRTWDYPGPYPIPPYDDGGYDLFFIGWSWDLDWDPIGLFDTPSITPNGDNFYQYSNPVMDWALSNYTNSYVLEDRLHWCKQIQAILYEDLPQITTFYSTELIPVCSSFDTTSWNGVLWLLESQPMENWSIPTQTEFRYACPADFEDFHPYFCESVFDRNWLHQIFNGLVERNALQPYYNSYSPRLATSIESNDGLTYNISINPNAKWADGHVLNASDVKYSYDLMINPEFENPVYYYWTQYIDNSSVKIISEYEVSITFLTKWVFQENNLALDLVPKHIWESIPVANQKDQAADWAMNNSSLLLGAGPYYLFEYDNINEIIHLKRNDYFADWSGIIPKFSDIYFKFYSDKVSALNALTIGDIDMIDAQFVVRLDEIPAGFEYVLIDDSGTQEIAINNLHPYIGTGESCPISSPESGKYIRKAISHIIPREVIIEESPIYWSIMKPGITPCPSVAIGFDKTLEPYEYNMTLAKEYMEKAGFSYPTIIGFSDTIGEGFAVALGIIALAGSCIILISRIKKK